MPPNIFKSGTTFYFAWPFEFVLLRQWILFMGWWSHLIWKLLLWRWTIVLCTSMPGMVRLCVTCSVQYLFENLWLQYIFGRASAVRISKMQFVCSMQPERRVLWTLTYIVCAIVSIDCRTVVVRVCARFYAFLFAYRNGRWFSHPHARDEYPAKVCRK